jgi:hypothetical protein
MNNLDGKIKLIQNIHTESYFIEYDIVPSHNLEE